MRLFHRRASVPAAVLANPGEPVALAPQDPLRLTCSGCSAPLVVDVDNASVRATKRSTDPAQDVDEMAQLTVGEAGLSWVCPHCGTPGEYSDGWTPPGSIK